MGPLSLTSWHEREGFILRPLGPPGLVQTQLALGHSGSYDVPSSVLLPDFEPPFSQGRAPSATMRKQLRGRDHERIESGALQLSTRRGVGRVSSVDSDLRNRLGCAPCAPSPMASPWRFSLVSAGSAKPQS